MNLKRSAARLEPVRPVCHAVRIVSRAARTHTHTHTRMMANSEQPTGIIRPGKYWVGILCVCVCVYLRRRVRTLNLPRREVLLHYNVHNKCSILCCTIMNIIRVCDDYLFNNKPQARCRSVRVACIFYAIV